MLEQIELPLGIVLQGDIADREQAFAEPRYGGVEALHKQFAVGNGRNVHTRENNFIIFANLFHRDGHARRTGHIVIVDLRPLEERFDLAVCRRVARNEQNVELVGHRLREGARIVERVRIFPLVLRAHAHFVFVRADF